MMPTAVDLLGLKVLVADDEPPARSELVYLLQQLPGIAAVHEAAVISCRHPRWDERPLLVVVRKPGKELTRDEMLAFYDGKIAKWQVPDDVVFVDEIPHTATGKIQKLKLREQFAEHRLPAA